MSMTGSETGRPSCQGPSLIRQRKTMPILELLSPPPACILISHFCVYVKNVYIVSLVVIYVYT